MAFAAPAQALTSTFNQLVLERADLEKRFGVRTLECFPFIRNIGFTEDQVPLIQNCLTGARTLRQALEKISEPDYRSIGIGSRFMRMGGFHTVMVPWDASQEDMIRFLEQRMTKEGQNRFLDKIYSLKRAIAKKIQVRQLFCNLEISNDQCLTGYENLAAVTPVEGGKKIRWNEIVITGTSEPRTKPRILGLGYDNSPAQMLVHLLRDIDKEWSARRKIYEEIESRYEGKLKKRLRHEKFICPPDLSGEECLQGAANFLDASRDEALQDKFWGRITLDRHNTIIKDDFHVTLRYDLPGEKIVRHFSGKQFRAQATKNNVLAEKLEGKTKNNPTRLRAVCDLDGLQSDLCAAAFKTFINFVKADRTFWVRQPWTTLMFIDGSHLARVNFALNSSSRDTYLYIDAGSGIEEFKDFLGRFGGKQTD